MIQQDTFQRMVTALHEAAFDDSNWRNVSGLIDEACGALGNHLVLCEGNSHDDLQLLFGRQYHRGQAREELTQEYAETYFDLDERLPRLLQNLLDAWSIPGSCVDKISERRRSITSTYAGMMPRTC